MSVTILEIVQNTPEWLKEREHSVGGSNSDILLTRGLDEALKANLNHFNGNYYTQRGHILEVEAIELYEAINERPVARPGMVKNSRFPNAHCSPDGLDLEYLIEVKCFGEKKHLEIMNVKTIPFKVMSQLQFNMMICELKLAKLVMYNPEVDDDNAYREIIVKADAAIQRNFARKLGVSA